MRFHQSVGVLQPSNDHINVSISVNNSESRFLISSKTNNQLARINGTNLANANENLNLTRLQSVVAAKRSENSNNFDSTIDAKNATTLDNILKFKNDSKYFKGFKDTDTSNIDSENGNNGIIYIETLNFSGDHLLEFVTSSPATPTYDNCVTNQSYNKQNCLSNIQIQRRENLIKLDLVSNYMTKHEGPMQVGDNSAGCSVESSPVDSLLDDQELLSPSPSSCADLSSPDPNDLQKQRRYPRGIVNPNYPGFQHLAHTLAEHFIDHHHQFEPSSDSEISEDSDFDVAYRTGNLGNVNIMSDINDSNNNNEPINNNGDGPDKNIDLNRNKNRRSSFSKLANVANDFGSMMESVQLTTMSKEYEDGNDNLLMKSEPKVFCESKQLGLHEHHLEFERFSSEDEDEECCNVSTNVPNSYKTESDPNRMDFDEDDMADLSGEDDAAIKNELENIDKADNDFSENINCDLATYLQQYDFKMDLKKSYKYESESIEADEECFTDEDNSKLPTPDILIKHNNSSKKPQNGEVLAVKSADDDVAVAAPVGSEQCDVDVSPSDEKRDYQPDLIKSITDTINTNDNNQGDGKMTKIRSERMRRSGEGDNEISSPAEHEIPNNERETNDNDEKIINQVQTETVADDDDKIEINYCVHPTKESAAVRRNLPLSFESTSSTNVDIIGDFGKEIEKEIGLIVSGYRNATNEMCYVDSSIVKNAPKSIRPVKVPQQSTSNCERVFDENKFIEHLKYFSKMGDAALSNVEETIVMKNSLVNESDRHESKVNVEPAYEYGDEENFIPTAIVKPKYQKLSFDERQLPVCGSTDDNSWHSPTNTSSTTTITTTPRKVQKHLPKTQKSFAKHTRKLVNKGGELCVDYDVSDKEAISSLRHSERDIDCCIVQNSVAIVQPLKKVVDASVNMSDEKNQKPIDSSKNSSAMSLKHEQQIFIRNSSKNIAANEIASRMSECDDNNLNVASRKATAASVVRDCEKKVPIPTKKKDHQEIADIFDVYNIETALPVIDLEAIETHLMAAKEEEQKRKNDREAIRRRLAMGEEDDYFTDLAAARPLRKPNLQSRLQNGKNLQICFMNEAASDSESSDSETCPKLSQGMNRRKNVQRPSSLMNHRTASLNNNPYNARPLSIVKSVLDQTKKAERPSTLSFGPPTDPSDNNFFTHQARLQIEARMALAQAKDMAHMQMEIERQKQGNCPITDLVHQTLDKVGMKVPPTKRRLSRQMLTNMNIAQLQIIINEFHTFIETLNELLVKYLMDRDDLSMRQDSMLIDIEDITRYLAEKEEAQLNNGSAVVQPLQPTKQQQQLPPQQKHHIESKPAITKHIITVPAATITQRHQPPAFMFQQHNKKSLVVNGNGRSVVTSISREKIEQNGLHL